MKEMQRNLSDITNKKKEIEHNFQNRISNVETKLKSVRELFNANRSICHTGVVVELRSKKLLAPLEVKKKRIKKKQSTVQPKEPLREQNPSVRTRQKETRVEEDNSKDSPNRTKMPYPRI